MGLIDTFLNDLVGDAPLESLVTEALGSLVRAGGILSPAMAILGLILWTSGLNKRAGRSLVMWSVVFGVLHILLTTA